MKKGSNVQNTLVPGSSHYSNNLKWSFSKYSVVFIVGFVLLFITGYKKNELQDSSQKNNMPDIATRQGSKVRWIPYKGSFKALDEMAQAGTDADPMQKDQPTGTGIDIATTDTYTGGIAMHIPANVTYMATFPAANGDRIFETVCGYAQVKKYTKVFIYLL